MDDTQNRTLILSPLELRVLGVLVEKSLTTPDYYPLTLNALVAGCNQKTSRHPVMNATEAEIQMALDGLKRHTLAIESFGASGRVMRYAHNAAKVLGLPQAQIALLTALMLRGPQTPGELRVNCERMYSFPDLSSVEAYLDELQERYAMVAKLPKQPGSREQRYAQLLGGPVAAEAPGMSEHVLPEAGVTTGEVAALKAQVAALRQEVSELRALLEKLYTELGVKE
jgi:uncharacterized protein YceH (UPF0502 family)